MLHAATPEVKKLVWIFHAEIVEVWFCAMEQELAACSSQVRSSTSLAELWGDIPAVAHIALESFSASIAIGEL